jgi:uncharacterized protein (DUF362 family)
MEIRNERSRRLFLRDLGWLAGGAAAAASGLPGFAADEKPADLIVISGDDPKALVKKAVAEFGGMKRFVSKGDVVVVKPNIAWVRRPETASNTNPDVVAGLIEMAFDAGAKEVRVFDRTDRPPKDCYSSSGIGDAALKLGAKILYQGDMKTVAMPLKNGVHLKEAVVAKDAIECDCFINVPVAKHHGSTKLSMAMKNHMGVAFEGTHEVWHRNLHQAIADFAFHFKPKLTVLDAYRTLFRRGPAGGNLEDVQTPKKCIVGVDQAAVDAYGTTLFPMWAKTPTDIIHVAIAGKMGVGEIDLAKLRIREIAA